MLGRLSLGLAITLPVLQFTGLQLRAIQATDADEHFLFREYVTLRLLTALLALGAIAILACLAEEGGSLHLIIFLVGLRGGVLGVNEVFFGLYQHLEQMHLTGQAMIFSSVASLIALGAGLSLTGSMVWAIAIWAILPTLALTGCNIRWGRKLLSAARGRGRPGKSPGPFGSARSLFELTRLGFP